jgi:hypothetical protein
MSAWRWFFDGQNVVICVVNVVKKSPFFDGESMPLFSTLFLELFLRA